MPTKKDPIWEDSLTLPLERVGAKNTRVSFADPASPLPQQLALRRNPPVTVGSHKGEEYGAHPTQAQSVNLDWTSGLLATRREEVRLLVSSQHRQSSWFLTHSFDLQDVWSAGEKKTPTSCFMLFCRGSPYPPRFGRSLCGGGVPLSNAALRSIQPGNYSFSFVCDISSAIEE